MLFAARPSSQRTTPYAAVDDGTANPVDRHSQGGTSGPGAITTGGLLQPRVEEAKTMFEVQMDQGAAYGEGWNDDTDEGQLGWQERALCAQTDPEAFFPEKGGSTREAKKVCLGCDVRGECLEYALSNDERFGIWGGLSERERRKLKKRAV
jgi:WhiB family redox-sensing transcriptional regulator